MGFGDLSDLNNVFYIRLNSPLDVIKAVAEILIITYFVYVIFNLVRETRAWQLLKGIFLIVFITALSNILELRTLSFLLNNTFSVLAIGTVVIFQPELRRGLEKIGRSTLKGLFVGDTDNERVFGMVSAITRACIDLSRTYTGALIVIERETKVGDIITTGIPLAADVSAELIINIFTKNTPLHDGAVVIRDCRIEAATCYLPLTENAEVDKDLGTRHRAAIGVTEISDALVVVVSEETGLVSFIQNGVILRGLTPDALRELLSENLTAAAASSVKGISFLRSRIKGDE
ncbi:MAG: diadenylate cyclase CdaA [Clostridiales bacterium]|nr:diadenylate cyclase CdaA [Clostridiales bacterium]